MKFDPDDPRWTAYAFDELSASERAAAEVELQTNTDAQQFVIELRRTAEILRAALKAETAADFVETQRETILVKSRITQADEPPSVTPLAPVNSVQQEMRMSLAQQNEPRSRSMPRWAWIATGGVAAAVLVAIFALPALNSIVESEQLVHHREDDKRAIADSSSGPLYEETNIPADLLQTDTTTTTTKELVKQELGSSPVRSMSLREDVYREQPTVTEFMKLPRRPSEGKEDPLADRSASPGSLASPELGHLATTARENRISALTIDPAARQQRMSDVARALGRMENAEFAFSSDPAEREKQIAEIRRRSKELHDEYRQLNGETGEIYATVSDNPFLPVTDQPLSTFSIDVDTASYANVRRFLMQQGQLPPPAAVRIEEMLNYFRYDYPQPDGDVPFSMTTEVATCPWQTDHRLVRIGLKGREIQRDKRPVSNLVFLLDVSGSMQPANKLPLVREVMKLLVNELGENDRVAIVVYAGASGLVLPSTGGDQKNTILAAIEQLQAGGSTNGAGGIQQAYDVAVENFIKGGTNRVILATDGDFNVGITDPGDLVRLITDKAKSGVFLTTLGFGMGNLKDATLEQLADKGNGNYAYIDTMAEGRKVLVEELSGTLVTIAKDVKLQIEFNPSEVRSYRLIGYENRMLAAEDFNDDKKDAGEIGAGHTVTALYEVVPAKGANDSGNAPATSESGEQRAGVDPLRYQKAGAPHVEQPKLELTDEAASGELLTLKLRYKQPDGDTSRLLEHPVKVSQRRYGKASADFKFAASVAGFGMILRGSPHRGDLTIDAVRELAQEGVGSDASGYRKEFVTLVEKAKTLGAK